MAIYGNVFLINQTLASNFLCALEALMNEYGVIKIDVAANLPQPCSRCGGVGNRQSTELLPTDQVYEELSGDNPRLRPDVEKNEALEMLGTVIDKIEEEHNFTTSITPFDSDKSAPWGGHGNQGGEND
jgi:hypothetical protein